jgi:hypothetical protein
MAKKTKDIVVNLKDAVFRNPQNVIKELNNHIQGLKFTKVIQTYVLEDKDLKIQLLREGRVNMQGNLIWFGNKPDHTEGTVFCFQSEKNGMKQVLPTADNTQEITLDISKQVIKISTLSRIKCAVCGKFIEIFDTELKCPVCEAKAHGEHLKEWIKMKSSCPVCKKPLTLNRNEVPVEAED